jgi:hypothetical protein
VADSEGAGAAQAGHACLGAQEGTVCTSMILVPTILPDSDPVQVYMTQ